MIYAKPRYLPGGDRNIIIELGDEMSFDLNFLVHSLTASIRREKPKGIIELVPCIATIMVSYNPTEIGFETLISTIESIRDNLGDLSSLELESRMYYVPILYFDPWTEECVADYCKNLGVEHSDPDVIVEANDLDDRTTLRRIHASTDYWVAALGFWPGLCSLMPLNPANQLIAPKYNPPRASTPKGAIGLGGAITCLYPDQTPGGFRIFARTPMPIWDRLQQLKAFKNSPALFKPGDRVRFIPIDLDEFKFIDSQVEDGSYEHPYVDYQRFSLRNYKAWLADIGKSNQDSEDSGNA
ncbi:MAG: carboxyltransferase domain-containing protein [Gammaproteobacteria bacterium]|nr:MAG: carboxyltransferase domain-containing protein [Gammaproteobacteria bacterium]